jgi:hypothetical protein
MSEFKTIIFNGYLGNYFGTLRGHNALLRGRRVIDLLRTIGVCMVLQYEEGRGVLEKS